MDRHNQSIQKYRFFKEQILKIINKIDFNKELLPQNILILLENIQNKKQNLEKNQFVIAVAGEVKAGKSTFINSLLQEEILPYDVLQATSAIIEIFYSDKPNLKVTYASGKVDLFFEESKEMFKDILKRIASIPDEFRDIPTTLIDQYFLDFHEKPDLNDNFIKYLEEKSGMSNLSALKNKLQNYVDQLSLDKIPIRIELGYPFPWKFEELRIVDMPGVNAVGGVQDISFTFIERADAILFIHPIKPVESESFKKFVTTTISNRSKYHLFLILTHSAVFFEERDRLLEEAKRIYSSLIPPERIFAVDSVLKLIYEDLQRGRSPQEIRSDPNKRKWYILFKELAEDEGKDLKTFLLDNSGFPAVIKALENFILETPYRDLLDFLETLQEFFEELINYYEENIKILNHQKRDPEEFLKEIQIRQKGLENLESQCYLILEEAYINFMGTNSPLEKDINELKFRYYNTFSNIQDLDELRKTYRDAENELTEIVLNNQKQIALFFKEKLKTIGESLIEEYKINIPKIDLRSLEEISKKQATKRETIYKEETESLFEKWNFLKPWKWLKSSRTHLVAIGNKVVFDEKAYFNNLKTNLINDFIETIENLKSEFYRAFSFYKQKINEIINDRKEWLNKLKKELKTIEKIEHEILYYQKNILIIESEIKKIKMLKEEIQCLIKKE